MRLGAMLVDEFTTSRHGTSEFHLRNDPRVAYHAMAALSTRLGAEDRVVLKTELETVGALQARLAFLSGYGSEVTAGGNTFATLWGRWRVSRSSGDITIYARDILEFTVDSEFRITRGSRRNGEDEEETYAPTRTRSIWSLSFEQKDRAQQEARQFPTGARSSCR
jgi:hypothetical protein